METSIETNTVSEEVLQFVTFTLGNEEYAVDILNVQEINRITDITQIPNSPPYVEGVINLRGKVIPVINLRKKFNLEDKPTNDTSRIIIMDISGTTKGLIVDSVSEVLRIASGSVEAAPPMSTEIQSHFIKGIAKLDTRLIILIDLNKLLNESGEY